MHGRRPVQNRQNATLPTNTYQNSDLQMRLTQKRYRRSTHISEDKDLADLLAAVVGKERTSTKAAFTAEARYALLEELPRQSWTTARQAYGWVWNTLGVRVSYLTVWRFLNDQGLLIGDTLHTRRLQPPAL